MSILKFLLVPLVMSACSGGTPASPPEDGAASGPAMQIVAAAVPSVIELHYDEITDFQSLHFRLLKLQDSRCPIGVTCMWAGQILATIEVTHNLQGSAEIELLRLAGREPVMKQAFGFELRLLDASPHPKENVTPARGAYVVQLEVSQL